jgi:putative ABC transport system permease protein
VRQVARTSEALLRKVELLMALVTAVVVLSSAGSVAGTMSTTVLERGREIGLMKAMGGTRREVLALFAREAVAFGLCGGVLGFLVGNAIAELVTRTVFATSISFMPHYFPAALAISLGIALLGSLGALLTVYRLDPAQSLRGE